MSDINNNLSEKIKKKINNLTEDNTPTKIYNSGHSILKIDCFIVQTWFTQVT